MDNNYFISNQSVVFLTKNPDGSKIAEEGVTVQVALLNENQLNDMHAKSISRFINDFDLVNAKAVEKSWEQSERPIYDGMTARLVYKNGISVNSEPNRIIYRDNNPGQFVEEKKFFERAKNVYSLLNQNDVVIQSLGININLMHPNTDAVNYVYETFLDTTVFGKIDKSIDKPHIRLAYKIRDNESLNINLYVAQRTQIANPTFDEERCAVLDANYHYVIEDGHDDILSMIDGYKERIELLANLVPLKG